MQIIPDEFLPGFGPEEPKPSSPKTAEEWSAKRLEITRLFSPTAPVQAGLFVGRTSQITKVTKSILQGGQHVVVCRERMSDEEIQEIVRVELNCAGMEIDDDAIGLIVWLARGMPAVAHLLEANSAKVAIDHKTVMIKESFVISALQSCLDEVDNTTREAYARVIKGINPNNRHWKTILSCSTVLSDENGRFNAASIRDQISRIFGKLAWTRECNRYLNALCSSERGGILERKRVRGNLYYRFVDPIMQSYVLIKGISDGMLPMSEEC